VCVCVSKNTKRTELEQLPKHVASVLKHSLSWMCIEILNNGDASLIDGSFLFCFMWVRKLRLQ